MATQSSPHAPSDVSVMLSYSRTDAAFAQKLCDDLKAAGFPTWLDTNSILGGRLWRDEIDRAIDEAQVVLVVMSPAAMKSKWVRREYTYAARQGKVIIPLDYYPCDIPALLADRQLVSFRPGFVNTETFYTRQLQQLIAALAGSAALGSPAPLAAATPSSRAASRRHQGTGALALMFLASFVLAALASYANGALLPVALQSYASRLVLGGIALGVLSLLSLLLLRARRPAGSVNLYLDDRIRFLTKVHTRYINRLKPPFAGAVQITLGLSEAAQAVAHPALARQEGPAGLLRSFPAGTTITTAFEEAEEQLLILGAPGAGKSWLLYALALNLVERARADRASLLPVPVVFDLASWVQNQRPLAEWMVNQLTDTWQVPPAIAQVWVDHQQFFPLLDGLDEVRQDAQDACVEAINRYQRAHGLFPLVVCCRKADYDALKTRLDLRTAVVAEPLTTAQIDTYLEAGAAPLAALRRLTREDLPLQDLLTTPLMLNIVALAYAGKETNAIPKPSDDKKAWTQAVFRDYVPSMLARRVSLSGRMRWGRQVSYSEMVTTRYLAWLAAHMQTRGQTDAFFLERLQPDWLSDDQAIRDWRRRTIQVIRRFYRVAGGTAFGMAFAPLAAFTTIYLFGAVATWQDFALQDTLLAGLAGAAGFALLAGYVRLDDEGINPSSTSLRLTWNGLRTGIVSGLFGGLGVWLVFGLVYMLDVYGTQGLPKSSGGLFSGLARLLGTGLMLYWVAGLCGLVFVGIVFGLANTFAEERIEARDITKPNGGVRLSLRSGVFATVVYVLLFGLVGGLLGSLLYSWGFWLTYGGILLVANGAPVYDIEVLTILSFGVGLAGGLVSRLGSRPMYGLTPYFQHQLLVQALVRSGCIPSRFLTFLDFAADHVLLQRVGGGYRFIHALLLDYFADQWPALSATERPKK